MKIKSTLSHDCGITTNSMIHQMEQISRALREIKRVHKYLKNWKKALDAGQITQEKFDDVLAKAKKIYNDNFESGCEYGMAIGQTDELDWRERSELHSQDMINDVTK